LLGSSEDKVLKEELDQVEEDEEEKEEEEEGEDDVDDDDYDYAWFFEVVRNVLMSSKCRRLYFLSLGICCSFSSS